MAKWICEDCGKEEGSYGKITYRRCPQCDLENLHDIVKKDAVAKLQCSDRVRPPCCYNCDYMGYTPGQHDQPHPELWCKKEVWYGAENKGALLVETDCKLYKRAD